ncbi:MAG TPA: 3-deoxy-manno-octulosonate cytidylyltransferase, partial [Alphaproteobacteria bacterium]|nr:3-deoxy-manno-octulosonate cytidylyltransferase [Alphaproteobacteria bacterium]
MEKSRPAPQRPILIVPARMTSTRLPGKPLADIGGLPMIVHAYNRAKESGLGPVLVACDAQEIVDVVKKAGGEAVLTDPAHPSGSDRIWEALQKAKDGSSYDAIINMQGDEPLIDPKIIRTAFDLLKDPSVDIGTLASVIKDEKKKTASQVCKAVIDIEAGASHGRALYFSRNPVPSNDGPFYHHVGLYAYRRDALERFVKAKPSPLEKREKLEQLRALSLGMRIEVGVIDTVPMGVDTPEDLEEARKA